MIFRRHPFVLVLLFLLTTGISPAHSNSQLDPLLALPSQPHQTLEQGVEFLLETSQLPWTAMEASVQPGWQLYPKRTLNFRQEKQAVWLRFRIHNPRPEPQNWMLISDWPLLDDVRLQTRTLPTGQWSTPEQTGDRTPLEQRSVSHRLPVLKLALTGEATTEVYVRVQSHNTMLIPLSLIEASAFNDWDHQQDALLAAFFSVLLAMLCYNACLLSFTRDSSYLFYCWYVGGIILFELAVTGTGNFYLWNEMTWLRERCYPVTTAFVFIGAALFLRNFLQLKTFGGWALRLNTYFLIYWWLALVLGSVEVALISDLQDLASMLSCIAGLGTTVYMWHKNNVSAKYFTIAWAFLIIATFFFAASMNGLIERTPATQYSHMIGFVLEVILLSFALAERINRERAAREEAQQSALLLSQQVAQERDAKMQSQNALIDMQRRANEDLELRVSDRTAELQRAMSNLEIANRELSKLSHTDGLTQVSNRRYFDQVFEDELHRGSRSQQPLSLLLVDLDHFKQVNDQHGHLTGDECLRQVAKTIGQVINRSTDLVARYGGEEFAVLLPFTSAEQAIPIAESIRREIAALDMIVQGKRVELSVSIGIAGWIPGINESSRKLIESADAALYQAKHAGRNQTQSAASA